MSLFGQTFRFYSDPGHGWLAVKRTYLKELNILNKITPYSYQKGESVYLEEDCDVTTFIKAFTDKFGVKPKIVEVYQNKTPIRYYEHFSNE